MVSEGSPVGMQMSGTCSLWLLFRVFHMTAVNCWSVPLIVLQFFSGWTVQHSARQLKSLIIWFLVIFFYFITCCLRFQRSTSWSVDYWETVRSQRTIQTRKRRRPLQIKPKQTDFVRNYVVRSPSVKCWTHCSPVLHITTSYVPFDKLKLQSCFLVTLLFNFIWSNQTVIVWVRPGDLGYHIWRIFVWDSRACWLFSGLHGDNFKL